MTLGALDDFWRSNDEWIAAVVTMVLAFALAYLVDRAFQRRSDRVANSLVRGDITPETATRLRFVRRIIYATILLIGLAIALSQFSGINRIAASVLASGVVAARTTTPRALAVVEIFERNSRSSATTRIITVW